MTITDRINQLPRLLGIKNLRQIAKEIDYSTQHMQNISKGARKPGLPFVIALVKKYPINPNWLLKGAGTPLVKKDEKQIPQLDTELYDMRKLVSEVDQLKKRVNDLEQNRGE